MGLGLGLGGLRTLSSSTTVDPASTWSSRLRRLARNHTLLLLLLLLLQVLLVLLILLPPLLIRLNLLLCGARPVRHPLNDPSLLFAFSLCVSFSGARFHPPEPLRRSHGPSPSPTALAPARRSSHGPFAAARVGPRVSCGDEPPPVWISTAICCCCCCCWCC